MENIILGGGCFWCTEAIFNSLKGIQEAIPGYSGGTTVNPSYNEVCTGKTGHAEVVKITYDPETITTEQILEIFFRTHDPTSLNRQGADVGTQYRSIIIYTNENQKRAALEIISEMEKEKVYEKPIVTSVENFRNFYPAEEYHRRYFEKNPEHGYCRFVIAPKMEKLRKLHSENMKNIR
jgi:methionine-S-sulfoxide reductase